MAEWKAFTSLSEEQMQSIWNYDCKDPFAFLGIHPLQTDKGVKTVVRTYQPHASFVRAESMDGSVEFDFIKLGDSGFYEAVLDMFQRMDNKTVSIDKNIFNIINIIVNIAQKIASVFFKFNCC